MVSRQRQKETFISLKGPCGCVSWFSLKEIVWHFGKCLFILRWRFRWDDPFRSPVVAWLRTLSQALYLTTFLYFAWAFPGFQRETFDFWECHLSLLLFMELENQILLSLKVRETENQMIMLLHDWWIFKKATVCLQVCHTKSNRGLPEQTPRRLRCLPANSSLPNNSAAKSVTHPLEKWWMV